MSDDPDPETLAEQILDDLDPGTVIDDKVILSKRQVALVLGTPATLAGVLGLGAGSASAQSSGGQLGTSSEPIEANLANYGSTSTADGFEITIDGDTYQINE